jgi:hypothetical protein
VAVLEKIKTVDSIYKKQQLGTTNLTEGAMSSCKKILHPAINCLNNHFDGDAEAFAGWYPNFKHTLSPSSAAKEEAPLALYSSIIALCIILCNLIHSCLLYCPHGERSIAALLFFAPMRKNVELLRPIENLVLMA